MSGTNASPMIFQVLQKERPDAALEIDDNFIDPIDAREVFDHIRHINDPEHPHTLEELRVVEESLITVNDENSRVYVNYTPTIPHCSMASLIGLAIRVQLARSLPSRFKLFVSITPGSHDQEGDINKQINDKERVAAAMENPSLFNLIQKIIP